MKVTVKVIKGPGRGRVFEFAEPRGFVIGRAGDADFRISRDPYVSRRHIFLEICPPRCRLIDLGSTNPPSVDGKPVRETDLSDGNVVELGFTRFQISIQREIDFDIVKLRIVHGKGIGVKREIVHSLLDKHPHVVKYYHEGGSGGSWGATVVDLSK